MFRLVASLNRFIKFLAMHKNKLKLFYFIFNNLYFLKTKLICKILNASIASSEVCCLFGLMVTLVLVTYFIGLGEQHTIVQVSLVKLFTNSL